jgi:hypothetical protein
MSITYFTHILDLPRQASGLWGTELDSDPNAVEKLDALLRQAHLERCWVVEVAAKTNGRVGLSASELQHIRAIASVFDGWFIFDRVRVTAHRCSAKKADLLPVNFESTTVLVPGDPNVESIAAYQRAHKLHLLNLRFGRPSVEPERPIMLDLFADGRPGVRLAPVISVLAELGGIAFFRSSASRTTLVTWTRDEPSHWLDRWSECTAGLARVEQVDDLPVD